jgi:hypothetical protein
VKNEYPYGVSSSTVVTTHKLNWPKTLKEDLLMQIEQRIFSFVAHVRLYYTLSVILI